MKRDKKSQKDQDKKPALSPPEVVLDRHGKSPLYQQIFERLSEAIRGGHLRSGKRLPSVRSLAHQLATSRGTVEIAYSLLSSQGYASGRGAAGTVVSSDFDTRHQNTGPDPGRTLAAPFQMGLPALDAFPRKVWSRIHVRITRTLSTEVMLAGDSQGFLPLRQAIASYLSISRGISCSAQKIFVTSGFQSTLGLLARAYIKPGDEVWFDDPGFFLARRGFECAGARLVPVPVDGEGLDVRTGIAWAPSARMVYVTPSHQAPLGVSLSPSRRLELLKWAAAESAWILEYDYDSEFRYGSQPLPALKSLDGNERVFYTGTFSKVLFPGLRLGYLVAPDSQVEHIARLVHTLYRDRPVPPQATLAEFMIGGYFARHIRRMRMLYAERRSALAAGLQAAFGSKLKIRLEAGGMHLLARIPDGANDVACATAAAKSGFAVTALSQWCLTSDQTGLLLSFTNIPSRDARDVAVRLRRAIQACL